MTSFLQPHILIAALLFSVLAHSAHADDKTVAATGKKFYTARTSRAVDDGLKYLASRQATDGSFGSGRFRGNVAVTSLSGMAFLAGGHSPGRGKYGKNVRNAINYLLDRAQPNGYIVEDKLRYHGPMYGHGFATMFLAECLGMTRSRKLKAKLKKTLKLAVDTIVTSQTKSGGWRYTTDSTDADVSVTVCQVMALRAARNAGLFVRKKGTIDKALAYLKDCQNRDGGFRYQAILRGRSAFPRSAAGVVGLYSVGIEKINKGPEIRNGLRYLKTFAPRGGRRENHYFYGHYYAVQAMWHAGGTYWRSWYPSIRDEMLTAQAANGRWSDEYVCDEYATAMACLVLQMPVNYLPIFQR